MGADGAISKHCSSVKTHRNGRIIAGLKSKKRKLPSLTTSDSIPRGGVKIYCYPPKYTYIGAHCVKSSFWYKSTGDNQTGNACTHSHIPPNTPSNWVKRQQPKLVPNASPTVSFQQINIHTIGYYINKCNFSR